MTKQIATEFLTKARQSTGIHRVRFAIAAQRESMQSRFATRGDVAFAAHCFLALEIPNLTGHAEKSEAGRALAESRHIGW